MSETTPTRNSTDTDTEQPDQVVSTGFDVEKTDIPFKDTSRNTRVDVGVYSDTPVGTALEIASLNEHLELLVDELPATLQERVAELADAGDEQNLARGDASETAAEDTRDGSQTEATDSPEPATETASDTDTPVPPQAAQLYRGTQELVEGVVDPADDVSVQETAPSEEAAGTDDTSDETDTLEDASGDLLARLLLEDVGSLVDADRDTHGDAVENQEHIASGWTWYLRGQGVLAPNEELTGLDVAYMMAILKMSRNAVGEFDIDHPRDVAGYAGIGGACMMARDAVPYDEYLVSDYGEHE